MALAEDKTPPQSNADKAAPAPVAATSTNAEVKTSDNKAAVPTKPPEESPIPLVIRIDKSAVNRLSELEYDVDRPVDKIVLGARAVGDSRTIGKSQSVIVPNSTVATFDIVFQGRTTSTTVSVKEPGVVYGRTFTNLTCTRRVVFDPKQGFIVQEPTQCSSTTKLVLDGFGSTRKLGRRIITRIAERQSYKSFETARQIADRDNKIEVRDEFQKEVDKSLVAANESLNLGHLADQLFGKDSELEFFTKSDADSIQIGLGPAGEKYAALTQLPPRKPDSPGTEVFVHASILTKPVASALKLISPSSKTTVVEESKILGGLKILPSALGDKANVALQDGWLVLGLPDEPLPATAAATETSQRK